MPRSREAFPTPVQYEHEGSELKSAGTWNEALHHSIVQKSSSSAHLTLSLSHGETERLDRELAHNMQAGAWLPL